MFLLIVYIGVMFLVFFVYFKNRRSQIRTVNNRTIQEFKQRFVSSPCPPGHIPKSGSLFNWDYEGDDFKLAHDGDCIPDPCKILADGSSTDFAWYEKIEKNGKLTDFCFCNPLKGLAPMYNSKGFPTKCSQLLPPENEYWYDESCQFASDPMVGKTEYDCELFLASVQDPHVKSSIKTAWPLTLTNQSYLTNTLSVNQNLFIVLVSDITIDQINTYTHHRAWISYDHNDTWRMIFDKLWSQFNMPYTTVRLEDEENLDKKIIAKQFVDCRTSVVCFELDFIQSTSSKIGSALSWIAESSLGLGYKKYLVGTKLKFYVLFPYCVHRNLRNFTNFPITNPFFGSKKLLGVYNSFEKSGVLWNHKGKLVEPATSDKYEQSLRNIEIEEEKKESLRTLKDGELNVVTEDTKIRTFHGFFE